MHVSRAPSQSMGSILILAINAGCISSPPPRRSRPCGSTAPGSAIAAARCCPRAVAAPMLRANGQSFLVAERHRGSGPGTSARTGRPRAARMLRARGGGDARASTCEGRAYRTERRTSAPRIGPSRKCARRRTARNRPRTRAIRGSSSLRRALERGPLGPWRGGSPARSTARVALRRRWSRCRATCGAVGRRPRPRLARRPRSCTRHPSHSVMRPGDRFASRNTTTKGCSRDSCHKRPFFPAYNQGCRPFWPISKALRAV